MGIDKAHSVTNILTKDSLLSPESFFTGSLYINAPISISFVVCSYLKTFSYTARTVYLYFNNFPKKCFQVIHIRLFRGSFWIIFLLNYKKKKTYFHTMGNSKFKNKNIKQVELWFWTIYLSKKQIFIFNTFLCCTEYFKYVFLNLTIIYYSH